LKLGPVRGHFLLTNKSSTGKPEVRGLAGMEWIDTHGRRSMFGLAIA
jgi:hypothetical protein